MRRSLLFAVVLGLAGQAHAQAGSPGDGATRRATLMGGVGNDFGWLGLQGEAYVANQRISIFGGLGYTPAIDAGDPSGVAVAAGVRGFTRGATHRGFLELGVSQVAIESGTSDGARFYGPAVQAGWQYTARRGFTAMVSLGLGYAPDDTPFASTVVPVLGIGGGYTWRR